MKAGTLEAQYLIETPFEPEKVAAIMAGEQSSGTFVRVAARRMRCVSAPQPRSCPWRNWSP